ncbi:sterol desaturase family protein [Pseudanabaena sp. FACHB-1998]|uniref:sterol desaturase family protein n=1 Tax=Pseudanabaena sp. FACHB-1998 TaxID=2692858 RepID=UPI0016803A17|nr:sterol desaturase family protein [Pseudanabaena sp. FACHB-1998]MBD2178645.1 sterol desaturase family protein [Pseudanabaena sp. FACHB-1998]
MLDHSFLFYGIAFFAIILARYFLVTGGMYLLFYAPLGKSVEQQNQTNKQFGESIKRDIQLSILSAVVFAIASALIICLYRANLTRIYLNPNDYGLWYLGLSYGTVLILQDAYFYFTHRLFHHPSLFRWFHQGHHRSRHPTPWTSFAFDPLEAIVSALFLVGIVLIVPLHFITLIAILTTMTIWAVLNHLGLDYLSLSFPHHWLGKWFIGPAHHSIHHLKYNLHYGLYFTFWDKLFNTQDPNYEKDLMGKLKTNEKS